MADLRSPDADLLADVSGDRLRQLVESARIGIIEFDVDGRGVYVNRHWRELTGYRGATPIEGPDLLALIHPDDRGAQRANWLAAQREPHSFTATLRFQHPDGSITFTDTQVDPVYDEQGAAAGFVASIIDVTDRHIAEDQLRRRAARYRRMVDESPVGQVMATIDGVVVEANQAMGVIMRCPPEDLIGKSPVDLAEPADAERAIAEIENLRSDEIEASESDLRVRRADGTLGWVRATASTARDEGDQRPLVQVVVRDITDEKEAEERLRASEIRYRTMVDSLHDGVLIYSGASVEAANRSAAEILGVTLDELINDPGTLHRLPPIHPDGRPFDPEERPGRVAMVTGRPVSDATMGITHPSGELRWLSMNAWPLADDDDDVTGVVVSISDITERKGAADALRASEERYRRLVESSPIGQLVADLEGCVIEANQAMAEMLGRAPDELPGLAPQDTVHPDDMPALRQATKRLLHEEVDLFTLEMRLLRPQAREVWAITTTTLLRDADGKPTNFLTLVQDVTERRAAEEESRRLAHIVESTSDLVGLIDFPTGRLRYLNRAGRQLFGFVDRDVTTVSSLRLYASTSIPLFASEVEPAIKRGESWTGEVEMRRADGGIIQVLQTVTGELGPDGEITQLWSVGRDITERKRKEVDLAHQATHDPLTDLPNRSLLLDHLELALARASRRFVSVALLFLDLDRFKTVNDNLGHEAGDELLVEVSERIRGVLRPADTLARLGGDEFVILCEDIEDEHHAVTVADRISSAIEARSFNLSGATIDVTASVGIALATDDHTHPEALLRDADAAMYRAKDRGRARHELFDEAMRRRSARRHELAEELAEAIEQGEIAVHFQPLIDLRTGSVTGVEALARWEHPVRGTLPPYEFIGVAEETGLIVGLGLAVLSRTCDQVRRWEIELGSQAPRVHVNLSARQLTHSSLPTVVAGVLEQSLIGADRLCFEITESVLMEDAAKSVAALEELKEIGVELAIDDFGTGYSSLSYLRRFPVDVIKVDRSFVDGLGPDPHDSSIVAAIVNLAHTLDLRCVAEGVETTEQLAELRKLGCDAAQGFLFARPMPVPEVNRYLTTQFELTETAEGRRRRRKN